MVRKNTIKSFSQELPKELSVSEIGRVYLLSQMMSDGTNMIGISRNKKVIPAKIKDMMPILGFSSERATVEFIRRLSSLGIVKRVSIKQNELIPTGKKNVYKHTTEKRFYMNPRYFFNNKWLSLSLYHIFKDDLDKSLPEWVVENFNKVDA
jgi:hypothetical protein